ncbi:MAG TPA: SAM-dependent methyltransferase [Chitinophagaceae bacterium]|nr:SAM-dependent methyltransferase [Chitinophagaceae bacterium]HAN39398.1 SAM-dependent methyltransferase [Chitinophagaceae bacterium]
MPAKVYLIPTTLHDDEASLQALPSYLLPAIQDCQVFFVENEKTTRRFFKKLWREMVIDNYTWHTIHKAENEVLQHFKTALQHGKNIGIVSEAGCPGIADPGQILIAEAQQFNATIQPLVGPSSILLALMASGLNGQQFQFLGYLPIDAAQRKKAIKEAELYAHQKQCTQLCIETPYRNNAFLADLLQQLQPNTRVCIAADLTAPTQYIVTKTVAAWRQTTLPDLHKRPCIFLWL